MKLQYGTPQEAGLCPDRVKKLDTMLSQWVEEGFSPSIVTLIARKGIIALHKAYGVQSPEKDSPPLQTDSIYPVASISKPTVATAIMILQEEGKLSITRPVKRYIPEFTGEGKDAVCVHHLLTHTSGMRDDDIYKHGKSKGEEIEFPEPEPNQDPRTSKRLFLGCDAPLWKKPGEEMSYCNFGYELLGEIIRRVSGQSLNEFTRKRIFEPLGMKDSYFTVPDELIPRGVKRGSQCYGAEWFSSAECFKQASGAGGLCTTAMDLAIFGQMFLNKGIYGDTRILSPLTVRTMTYDHIPGVQSRYGEELFKNANWGLGWNIQGLKKEGGGVLRSPETFQHSGAGGTFLMVDPVNQTVTIYLSASTTEGQEQALRHDHFNNVAMACVIE